MAEFGSPASYASRFSRDAGAARRRQKWAYVIAIPAMLALALEDVWGQGMEWGNVSWPFAGLAALLAISAFTSSRGGKGA